VTLAGSDYHLVWHCAQLASSEYCTLFDDGDGYRFVGVVVVPLADLPCRIDYTVHVDGRWRTNRVHSSVTTPRGVREFNLRSRSGGWELDGEVAPHLEGCDDVDLGWTPATNSVPIRRMALDVGESRSITAAWVRFPEMDVVRNVQTYTRLASDRWRYQAGEYEFELVTDEPTGLVVAYGDDLWRASAISRQLRD
jgi:hypothetical protein